MPTHQSKNSKINVTALPKEFHVSFILILVFGMEYFTSKTTLAQNIDSLRNREIEREINKAEEADISFISKGRRVVIEQIEAGNYDKAKETRDYLIEKYKNKSIIPFYLFEKISINLLFGEYLQIISEYKKHYNSDKSEQSIYDIYPNKDDFWKRIINTHIKRKNTIDENIKALNLDGFEKDFLLIVNYYFADDNQGVIVDKIAYQDSLNSLCNTYLFNYPNSPFNPAIKDIRFVVKPIESGLKFMFSLGYGRITGEFGKQFTNDAATIGMGIEYYKNSLLFGLNWNFFGAIKTKENTGFLNQIWEKGQNTSINDITGALGYLIQNEGNFHLIGFINGGMRIVENTKMQNEEPKPEFSFNSPIIGGGLIFDFNMGEEIRSIGRIQVGYSIMMSRESALNGGIFYINLGWGFGNMGFEREK
ncbi:MAG: hypothetical protein SFU91_14300 [Chloroherpetonaceae bacterium]|nr:hypothetical protein [Chloroherpetonaceae bacterium]